MTSIYTGVSTERLVVGFVFTETAQRISLGELHNAIGDVYSLVRLLSEQRGILVLNMTLPQGSWVRSAWHPEPDAMQRPYMAQMASRAKTRRRAFEVARRLLTPGLPDRSAARQESLDLVTTSAFRQRAQRIVFPAEHTEVVSISYNSPLEVVLGLKVSEVVAKRFLQLATLWSDYQRRRSENRAAISKAELERKAAEILLMALEERYSSKKSRRDLDVVKDQLLMEAARGLATIERIPIESGHTDES